MSSRPPTRGEPRAFDSVCDHAEDLKVHLANGPVVPFGQPVRVSGTVYFPVSGVADVDFTCGFDNPLVESA